MALQRAKELSGMNLKVSLRLHKPIRMIFIQNLTLQISKYHKAKLHKLATTKHADNIKHKLPTTCDKQYQSQQTDNGCT